MLFRSVADRMKREYLEGCIGSEMDVLFETEQGDGSWNGHAGNYCVVNAKGADLKNKLCRVLVVDVQGDCLRGKVI